MNPYIVCPECGKEVGWGEAIPWTHMCPEEELLRHARSMILGARDELMGKGVDTLDALCMIRSQLGKVITEEREGRAERRDA